MSGRSDVRDGVGDLVKRRVPVHLVAARREERILLVRAGSGDVSGPDYPDADALVPPGVEVARMMQRHGGIGRVERPDVHVVEPALTAQEHLEQRPVRPRLRRFRIRALGHAAASFLASRAARLAAWAAAASLTHAPPSCAARRPAIRCALHGPLPLMTRLNSAQSGWPKS